jgi:hypothetical protein
MRTSWARTFQRADAREAVEQPGFLGGAEEERPGSRRSGHGTSVSKWPPP